MTEKSCDVAVVGMGIVGLAHAYWAARAGRSVVVIDRESAAIGASVRNFGFVTVSGQQRGDFWRLARQTRDVWLDVARATGLPVLQRGLSVVARRPEAAAVLEAFLKTEMGEGCDLLTPEAYLRRFPGAPLRNCEAVMWSPHEARIEARDAPARIAEWLAHEYGVHFMRKTNVHGVGGGCVETAQGMVRAETIFVCPGDDLATLYPDLMRAHEVTRCKLQMLRLAAPGPRLPSPVMSDLGLVRYLGYSELPEAAALKRRLEEDQREELEHGVHLIVVQSAEGSLVVGDSHSYDASPDPFGESRVDELILAEFDAVFEFDRPEVIGRWIGTYASSPKHLWFAETPEPGVELVVVTCGAGMSTSFGIAERVVGETLNLNREKSR